jgi:H+/Cl- antiporter ClcA
MTPICTDVIFGIVGGALVELLKHYRLAQESPGPLPDKFKGGYYWTVTIAMILAGGIFTLTYKLTGSGLNPILDMNIGASAPLIIGSFAAKPPKID